ncbi:MAG: HD domain-containing phosphohydrolase [Nitrospirota bacterium]
MDRSLVFSVILPLSVIFQLLAALLALRLIRVTGRSGAWILIASAVSLLALHQIAVLYFFFVGRQEVGPGSVSFFFSESLVLFVSVFMIMGISLIKPHFVSMKRSKEEMENLRHQNEMILNSAGEGIFGLDLEGRHTFVNASAARMLGYTSDELIGRTSHTVWHHCKEDGSPFPVEECPIYAAYKDGEVRSVGYDVFWRKDKTCFAVEYSSNPIRENGSIAGAVVTFRDVTDRRRAERELERLRRQNEMILNSAGDGIIGLDLEGRHTFANPAAAKMLGYQIEELIGCRSHEIWHCCKRDEQHDPEEDCPIYATFLQGSVSHANDEIFWRKDGTSFPVEYTSTPIVENGKTAGVVVTFKDITERVQHERELVAIFTVATALRTAPTYSAMLPVILDQTIEVLKVEGAAIAMRDTMSGDIAVELARGSWAPWTGIRLPQEEGVTGHVIKTMQPYISSDALRDSRVVRPDLFGELNAVACAPLIVQGQTIGALWIGRKHIINREEVRLLTAIGEIAANAIHRATLHEQTKQRLHRLAALHTIDMAITASLDLRVTLNILLDQVTAQLGTDAATVLLFNQETLTLEYAAGRGFHSSSIQKTKLKLGEGHAGSAALSRRIVSVPNCPESDEPCMRAELLSGELFVAHHAAPLVAKGQVKGVLEVFHRKPLFPDNEWLEFLEALASQTAIALDNAELFESMQRSNVELTMAYNATIEGWSRALDMRDRETEGHSRRVTEMTLLLARAMGVHETEMVHIRRGALLHDMGKMGIPDSILHKAGPHTPEEREIMRRHPVFAFEMLSPISFLKQSLDIPYCHHEKWDGTGYPRGLKGEQIPLAARIFAVMDVWDALRSERPYRRAWPDEKAREYIRSNRGKHFDPDIVEAFFNMKW